VMADKENGSSRWDWARYLPMSAFDVRAFLGGAGSAVILRTAFRFRHRRVTPACISAILTIRLSNSSSVTAQSSDFSRVHFLRRH